MKDRKGTKRKKIGVKNRGERENNMVTQGLRQVGPGDGLDSYWLVVSRWEPSVFPGRYLPKCRE